MKKHLFNITAAALAVLCSCNSDDEATQAQQPSQIRLTSTLEGNVTRSFDASNIPVNNTVWVWADQINASNSIRSVYFKAWKLTTDGNGSLSSTKAKNYPATNGLDFFGLKGNFNTTIDEGTTELPVYDVEKELDGIIHVIEPDQTTSADYYKSDLLYAQLKEQTATNSAAELNFYHMLSRVQIVLIPRNGGTNNNLLGTTDLQSATVTILGVKNKVKFTADRSVDINNEETGRALREAMLTIPATDNEATSILVKTETSMAEDLTDSGYGDAIVAPKQTFAAGTRFIQVDYMGETTYFTLADDLTLESGKRYRFKLFIDRIGHTYTVRPTIADWNDVDGGEMWVESNE